MQNFGREPPEKRPLWRKLVIECKINLVLKSIVLVHEGKRRYDVTCLSDCRRGFGLLDSYTQLQVTKTVHEYLQSTVRYDTH
jgi:hypothetical protein